MLVKQKKGDNLLKLSPFQSGATRIRTGDTRIFSPMLYQLSYGTVLNCGAKVVTIFRTAKVLEDFFNTHGIFCALRIDSAMF